MARWVQLQSPAYFYPRPPRGGRPLSASSLSLTYPFLSTPSARRATTGTIMTLETYRISIHALREEGDDELSRVVWAHQNFYPRPPRGGRPFSRELVASLGCISIHALREEGDILCARPSRSFFGFLSTPSARRATMAQSAQRSSVIRFLSTPSARRATCRRRPRS